MSFHLLGITVIMDQGPRITVIRYGDIHSSTNIQMIDVCNNIVIDVLQALK